MFCFYFAILNSLFVIRNSHFFLLLICSSAFLGLQCFAMDIKRIPFWKLTGSGNDFICIDNCGGLYDELLADSQAMGRFVRTLCRRRHGVGADGLIFADKPEIEGFADIGARFFEADGSECELCGNGTACFTHFAFDASLVPDHEVKILTLAGVVLACRTDGQYIRVCIPSPESRRPNLSINVDKKTFRCDYSLTGVPHLVTYVDDIDKVHVECWGRALRHHHDFQPRGVNVNFVQVLDEGKIAVRTFEFGVEAETLACGTGSSASAIETAIRLGWGQEFRDSSRPVLVRVRSGQILRVYFKINSPGESDKNSSDESDLPGKSGKNSPGESDKNLPDDYIDYIEIRDVCLETTVTLIARGQLHGEFLAEALA